MASSEVFINVRDHGKTVDVKKQRIKCNYCDKEMSGFSRLKYHLGGVRGNVLPCGKVPQDVKKLFRDMVQGREHLHNDAPYLYRQPLPLKRNGCPHNNVAKKTRHQSSESSGDESREYGNTDSMSEDDLEDSVASCKRMVSQSPAVIGDPNQESGKQNKRCIGRFFFETGTDFKLVNSLSFQRLMNDIRGPGQAEYKIPDCLELKGWILKDEVKEIQEYVQKIRQSWGNTGCSILLDGWID
ncbi:hypothetical protein Gogos_007898 [Gossypium gossypioides]|uniref:DUF659 domain-containing protein n=1 Tax=Gossypium gossypioides TaxID=34282 RepID=A0A7J9C9Y3_GOSGO|nr:hypothetical protein [Gossypium gossypioides]